MGLAVTLGCPGGGLPDCSWVRKSAASAIPLPSLEGAGGINTLTSLSLSVHQFP